jgi:hypothetical protein
VRLQQTSPPIEDVVGDGRTVVQSKRYAHVPSMYAPVAVSRRGRTARASSWTDLRQSRTGIHDRTTANFEYPTSKLVGSKLTASRCASRICTRDVQSSACS